MVANTFYAILNTQTNEHKVFSVNEDTYDSNVQLVCRVTQRFNGDGRCCCEFRGISDCPKHYHKPFARLRDKTVSPFTKLMADVNAEGINEWINFSNLLTWYFHNLVGETPRGNFKFYQSINCSRCGELLTNPQSIEKGIGPVCEEHLG